MYGEAEGVAVSLAEGEVDDLGGDDELPSYGGQVDGHGGEAAGGLALLARLPAGGPTRPSLEVSL